MILKLLSFLIVTVTAVPIPVLFPQENQFIQLVQKGRGKQLGMSTCEYTYSCQIGYFEVDCSLYQGRWNATDIKCTNGTRISCKSARYLIGTNYHTTCRYVLAGGNPRLSCNLSQEIGDLERLNLCKDDNSINGKLRLPYYDWAWRNQTWSGYFRKFWSKEDRTNLDPEVENCNWKKKNKQLWKCIYKDGDHIQFRGGLLGDRNIQYYPSRGNVSRIFSKKQPALKGHYWICGLTAYTHLPTDWTGNCYIGLVRPKFFFLPEQEGKQLGKQLDDDLERDWRSIDSSIASTGNANGWGNGWPPGKDNKRIWTSNLGTRWKLGIQDPDLFILL
uniref:Endogenous retrovirus group 3 member 1 Env polyprotein n=1 Tax=Phascolarctos cinereus TaxID=38626 RepID=A0A6P5JMA5_PHACI|nr:endogenous retrovirus group 3 member 1 Env polyprotein [Phascolarctos cinereus]XP_020832185.1 endogenous retrovirus group 3 member 1 Env polyprotein [Phascolarctos cinereus]XP_020832186.1 endogenous retrovirus group 3 member 1 Env polyprotein [Phascolarctos cinereus]